MKKDVWFLEGPFTQYEEDVKSLARKEGVRIIDSRFASQEMQVKLAAPKVPTVTKIGEKKKAGRPKKDTED